MSRIATVFGATGLQGGSVVRALLKDGTFIPRAVTRSVSSDAARALAASGAEVVEGDVTDYESVKRVIAGAEIVFGVTIPNFSPGGTEYDQGKYMVDAAKEAGVRFFVWSSLPSFSRLSDGKYSSPVFDGKAAVDDHLLASGIPHSVLLTGGFLENWIRPHFPGCPTLMENGEISIRTRYIPGSMNVFSWPSRDVGPSVLALLKQYDSAKLDEINGQKYIVGIGRAFVEDCFRKMEEGTAKQIGPSEKVNVQHLPDPGDIQSAMFKMAKEVPWYPGMAVPDPRLTAMGVEFGSMEEFVRTELKPFLGI